MSEPAILLVEDNPDDVLLTLRAFKESHIGNEVRVAADGVEALDMLLPADGSPGLAPAVVLLDLKLPRLDGLEVLRHLRADDRTRTQPVVVLTTSDQETDLIASYEMGANAFVRKPVDFSEFLRAASVLGLFWVLLNRKPPV